MKENLEPHRARIQKVGRVLWGFSLFWLIFNSSAYLVLIGTLVTFGIIGMRGGEEKLVEGLAQSSSRLGIDPLVLEEILALDFEAFMDHFWLSAFYGVAAGALFVVTMTFILKIAAAWRRGDVFGDTPIRCLRILGWIYLIHGIVGQVWGMAAQFVGTSYTCELIFFSFFRDVLLMSFGTSGSGIEWGLLVLTLSWILEHARLIRDEQELTV